jgi:hypothetical protein
VPDGRLRELGRRLIMVVIFGLSLEGQVRVAERQDIKDR